MAFYCLTAGHTSDLTQCLLNTPKWPEVPPMFFDQLWLFKNTSSVVFLVCCFLFTRPRLALKDKCNFTFAAGSCATRKLNAPLCGDGLTREGFPPCSGRSERFGGPQAAVPFPPRGGRLPPLSGVFPPPPPNTRVRRSLDLSRFWPGVTWACCGLFVFCSVYDNTA